MKIDDVSVWSLHANRPAHHEQFRRVDDDAPGPLMRHAVSQEIPCAFVEPARPVEWRAGGWLRAELPQDAFTHIVFVLVVSQSGTPSLPQYSAFDIQSAQGSPWRMASMKTSLRLSSVIIPFPIMFPCSSPPPKDDLAEHCWLENGLSVHIACVLVIICRTPSRNRIQFPCRPARRTP